MHMAKNRSVSLGIVSSLVLALLMTFMAPVGTMAALPDNEVTLGANGFVLSGAYSASAPGSFQPSTIVGPYQEGTCVPFVVQASHVGPVAGDMDFRISYRFQGGAIDGLEVMIGGPSNPMTATQLNDFSYPGTDLTVASAFSNTLGNNINATITGPFSENVVGADPILPGDLDRHYNITLQGVQPGETVNVIGCARLNANASQYSGTMTVSTSDSAFAAEGGVVTIQGDLLTSAPSTGSLTLNKVVVNNNGGTLDVPNFPLSLVNWDTSSTVSVTSGDTLDLAPGLYRFLEISSMHYQGLYSGDCNEYNNIVPGGPFPENGRGFVVINAGDVKSCTLTNDDYEFAGASIIVKKLVVNDDAGGTSVPEDFTLTVSSTPVLQSFQGTSTHPYGIDMYAGTQVFIPINTPYVVSEPSHPGYFPSFSGDCSGTAAFGEAKYCTVTNDDTTLGRITLNKVVVNDNGGTLDVPNFPLTLVNWDTSSTVSVVSGQTLDVEPGLYRFLEISSPYYHALYSGDCNEYNNIVPGGPFPENGRGFFTLTAGEIKSCTLTNDDYPFAGASVLVKKLVVNDNGGTKKPEDFQLTVSSTGVFQMFNGTSTNPDGGDLYAGTQVFLPINEQFAVSEIADPGYTATYQGDCSGTATFGELKLCTVINNDNEPRPDPTTGLLTLTKVVVNDNGGNAVVSDFPLSLVNWDTSTTVPVVSGQTLDLQPGLYRFLEVSSMFYQGLYSGDCSEYNNIVPGGPFPENGRGFVVINAGDVKSCTMTNDDYSQAGAIVIVKKLVVNDNGGTKNPEDFQLYVSSTAGLQIFHGTSTHPAGPMYAGTKVFVPINTPYDVGEFTDPGYTATFTGDCTGVVPGFGQVFYCTVTNNDNPPTGTVTIIKNVVNDDGGTAVAGDFTLLFNHENAEGTTIFQGDASGTVFTLANGESYNVTENPPANYQASFGEGCGGVAVGGEDIVCVVTNNDVEGGGGEEGRTATLIIQKIVVNDNGGQRVSGDFMISLSGNNPSVTLFPGDASGTVVTLEPGAYSVEEADPANYQKSIGANCSGTIAAGETKTCVITNDDTVPGSGGGGGSTVGGGGGGGGGSSGGGSTIPNGGSNGSGSNGSSIPGQVLGETSEDPGEDPSEDPGTPSTGTNDPGTPSQLPRTGLPMGLALAALLPLGLYARRRS